MTAETDLPSAPSPVDSKLSKPIAKKMAKSPKSAKKTNGKPSKRKGREKKAGLRLFQVRALLALKKMGDKGTAKDIANVARITPQTLGVGLGPFDDRARKARDKKFGYPCLLTLGLVSASFEDVKGREVLLYKLTAKGRKVAENVDKKLPAVHVGPTNKKTKRTKKTK
jgi:hypothetical protein